MPLFPARRIVVHAQNSCRRVEFFQLADHALRARAGIVDVPPPAGGARLEHLIARAAVVALETVFLTVIGERDVALLALGNIAAVAAEHRLRISPAVEKEDGLLPLVQAARKAFAQRRRKGRRVAAAHLPAHVHDLHVGQRAGVDALGHAHERKFAVQRALVCFHRGGGAAQHQLAAVVLCAQQRNVEGVVAGRALRGIAAVVLFVQHDDAHIFDRSEHRRTCADGDAGAPLAQALPFVEALPRRKGAVQDGSRGAEACAQLGEHLRREGNFRHEENCRLARGERIGNEREVHLRLAAARHAVQQRDRLLGISDRLDGAPLGKGQGMPLLFALHSLVGIAQDAPLFKGDGALFFQRVDGGAELLAQPRGVRLAVLLEVLQAGCLLRCIFCGDVLHKAHKGAVGLRNLPRAHLGRDEQPQAQGERHAEAAGDRLRKGKALGIDGGRSLLHAVHLFQFFGGIVARLLHAHDKAGRGAPPEGHGNARARLNGRVAHIIEDLVHLAVRDIDDDFTDHNSRNEERSPAQMTGRLLSGSVVQARDFPVHDLLAGEDDLLLLAGKFRHARRLHLLDDLARTLCDHHAQFVAARGFLLRAQLADEGVHRRLIDHIFFSFSLRIIS